MNSDSSVYVFVSAGGAFRGLSRLPDGVNLPQTDGIAWLLNDTIPLTVSALGKFVENSDPHHAWLPYSAPRPTSGALSARAPAVQLTGTLFG